MPLFFALLLSLTIALHPSQVWSATPTATSISKPLTATVTPTAVQTPPTDPTIPLASQLVENISRIRSASGVTTPLILKQQLWTIIQKDLTTCGITDACQSQATTHAMAEADPDFLKLQQQGPVSTQNLNINGTQTFNNNQNLVTDEHKTINTNSTQQQIYNPAQNAETYGNLLFRGVDTILRFAR